MTASTDPPQPDTEPTAEARRRPSPWLLGAGGVLGVVVAMNLLSSGGEDVPAGPPDLSTPVRAAQAFAQATAAGDVDGVLATTCLGVAGCAAEHGAGLTADQLGAAKKVIAENVHRIGSRFGYARFTTARPGAQPGTQEVDYRLPGEPAGERNYLVFVEYHDRWLYIDTGGGPTTTSPSPSPSLPAA